MDLQKVIDTASKYPWRYGFGGWEKCPLTKACDLHQGSGDRFREAAEILDVPLDHVYAFVGGWDATLDGSRKDRDSLVQATRLQAFGYTISAGPRLIRARRKTKRVRAYQYLRAL